MLVVHTDAVNINVSIKWRKIASDSVLASDAGVWRCLMLKSRLVFFAFVLMNTRQKISFRPFYFLQLCSSPLQCYMHFKLFLVPSCDEIAVTLDWLGSQWWLIKGERLFMPRRGIFSVLYNGAFCLLKQAREFRHRLLTLYLTMR